MLNSSVNSLSPAVIGAQQRPALPHGVPAYADRGSALGPASKNGISVIGNDLTILGDGITIITQNRLQIDGEVVGDVRGRQVVIGPKGSVIGTVSAENVEVFGGVRGDIVAVSVALHPSSKVDGEILNQSLVISEGAQLEGRVRRSNDAAQVMPVLDAGASSSQVVTTA